MDKCQDCERPCRGECRVCNGPICHRCRFSPGLCCDCAYKDKQESLEEDKDATKCILTRQRRKDRS